MIPVFFYLILSQPCPKVQLQTNPKVNITEYIRKSWYIQQQQVNGYQSIDDLNCVVATYNKDNNSRVPFFSGEVLSVYNYANKDKVNGVSMGTNKSFLCARMTNKSHPEKLIVSPCFLPNFLSGPYWILSVGPKSNYYEWAIVIGGQPTERISNTTCSTKTKGINNSGLWIFSRNKTLDKDNLDYLRNILIKKNISITNLLNVSQKGCNYDGAFIK